MKLDRLLALLTLAVALPAAAAPRIDSRARDLRWVHFPARNPAGMNRTIVPALVPKSLLQGPLAR